MNAGQPDIPLDLLSENSAEEYGGVDKYTVLSADESVFGSTGDWKIPVIQVPSGAPKDHGGSLGFDAEKPFSTIVKSPSGSFVMGDLTKLTPEQRKTLDAELTRRFASIGAKKDKDYSKILAEVYEKYLACTMPDGKTLKRLNTWTNGDRDPFGRVVKLPPPAIAVGQQGTRKAANMSDFFSHQSANNQQAQWNQGAAAAHQHFFAHTTPAQSQFGPPSPVVARQPMPPQMHMQPQQQQAPQIPPPDKTVMFHLGAGTFSTSFHFVSAVHETVMTDTGPLDIVYVVLVKNRNAPGAAEGFVPQTPAPGHAMFVTLPDSQSFQVHQVLLRYSIKTVDHIILAVSVPTVPGADEPLPEQGTDSSPIGTAAEPVTQEEAAIDIS